MGIYFQDQWAIRRLTLNYGAAVRLLQRPRRRESRRGAASGWVPARDFGAVSGRAGVERHQSAFRRLLRLFGNGKTALKASIGRYVAKTGTAVASANNPVTTSVNSITRTWSEPTATTFPIAI
jgi:hypothetical protein